MHPEQDDQAADEPPARPRAPPPSTAARRFASRFEPPPATALARRLYVPLLHDVRAQIALALRVAVLSESGHSRAQIAELTGCSPAQLADAWARLERVGHRPG